MDREISFSETTAFMCDLDIHCEDLLCWPSNQRETTLPRNTVSHWLGAYTDWSLISIILCMRPANERRSYSVPTSLIGWTHTSNDPWWCPLNDSWRRQHIWNSSREQQGLHDMHGFIRLDAANFVPYAYINSWCKIMYTFSAWLTHDLILKRR